MRKLFVAVILGLALVAGLRAVAPASPAQVLAAANDAWDRGDYIAALNGYIQILNAPGGDAFLEPIALQTGELFDTHELTANGRAPRFSPDGQFIAYETGLEVSRRTRIVRHDAALADVADLPGVSATFSPSSAKVAYLKLRDVDELRNAAKAIDEAPLAGVNRGGLVTALNFQILRHSSIVVRDLITQQETERLAAPELMKTGLVFGADGRTLYFQGARDGEETRTEIYAIGEGSTQPTIVADADGLKGPVVVDPSGAVLLYLVPTQNPFRRPAPPAAEGRGGQGGRGAQQAQSGRGGPDAQPAQGGRGGQPSSFAVVDLASRKVTAIAGTAPALSSDGRTLAYIARSGADNSVMVGAPLSTAAPVKKTTDRLDAPALSPDGRRVAYQMMTRDDWEIYVTNRDGSDEQRLTRDFQHDIMPRFVGAGTLIAAVGEPRHRRSFLYDLSGGTRARLFHNNTVRTIAPEYQWSVHPAGDALLVGAERDGNTVSPERGVYLVDLRRKVTRATVLARLRDNLASETALKAAGVRMFQPITADVRRVVARESVARVYEYEKALFDFDSKHITRPGNRLASEYLFNTYTSFGYEPEYQWLEPRGALGGKTANVIATLRGTVNPELVYVVSSHYDSVAGGPGADDDTSGTAALLEAARVLADHPMPATIVFASFTGEEAGLLGSREYVRRAVANNTQIVGALNNDMIGWANDFRLDNTIRYSNPGIRDVQHAAAMLFTKLITYDALYFKSTDAAAYYEAYGDIVGGIGSYPVLSSPHYHQAHDLLEFENHEQITETSKTTVATLMLLASSPSRITNLKVDSYTGATAALSWSPSPEKGIASYLVVYGPASNPLRRRLTVTAPHATLAQIAPGSVVSVKAVNARGMEGWDWAKVTVGDAPRSPTTAASSPAMRP